jgi:hypothetical protein
MPTLAKAQLIESISPWRAAYDRMYLELRHDRAAILSAIGFYVEHGLNPPEDPDAIPTDQEEDELRQIASALTVAAAASQAMSAGVLVATLAKVSKNPSLLFGRELPQAVEWSIACDYQRAEEPRARIGGRFGVTKRPRFQARSNNRPNQILRRPLTPQSQESRKRARPADPTIKPITFLRIDWARFFAKAANRFVGAANRSCGATKSPSLKPVPFMIFSSLF